MLILASSSPRRAEILRKARIEFTVEPAHINEDPLPNELPVDYVQRLAREKAEAVAARHPGALVLGADTTVYLDEHLLAKPENDEDAKRMLRLLIGRTHQVATGVALVGNGKTDVAVEITNVTFSPMSEQEIAEYVTTGEPMDKAGAYGIQGMASRWATRVEGCYLNVVGLPLPLVYRMLQARQQR